MSGSILDVRWFATAAERSAFFKHALDLYAGERGFSDRQKQVLKLHLRGKNDKDIAVICKCSDATVYEYWHRMARKVGGSYKSDVIADFHHFLGAPTEGTPGPVRLK